MPRKRKDPEADYPVTGKYQGQDTILKPREGVRYALLDEASPEFAMLRAKGFKKSERREGREDVPMYDIGSKDDTGYRVGNLVMYEADAGPDSMLVKSEEHGLTRANQRMKAIGDKARGTGGYVNTQVKHQPMVR